MIAAIVLAMVCAAEPDRVDSVDLVVAAEERRGPLRRLWDRWQQRPKPVREAIVRTADRIGLAIQIITAVATIAGVLIAAAMLIRASRW